MLSTTRSELAAAPLMTELTLAVPPPDVAVPKVRVTPFFTMPPVRVSVPPLAVIVEL